MPRPRMPTFAASVGGSRVFRRIHRLPPRAATSLGLDDDSGCLEHEDVSALEQYTDEWVRERLEEIVAPIIVAARRR